MNKISKMKKRLIFLALVMFLLIIPNIVSSAEIIANATKPDTVYTNTDFKLNITARDNESSSFTAYTQFYVNSSTSGSVVSYLISNNTNTNVANLSSSSFNKGATLIAEFWAGDGTANTTKENTTTITVNNSIPTQPNLTNPGNNSYTNTTITMNWTASTDVDSDNVSYYVLVNGTQECYTTDLNCSYTPPADGYYEWHVTPYDGYDNGTISVSEFYTYDTTTPQLVITSINNTLTNVIPSINGTSSDKNNNSVYANNSAWSWNNNYTNWGFTNNTNIADGNYHILITANDSAGNTNSSLFNFTYDSSGPSSSGVGKNDTCVEVNDTVLFYANWSDSIGLSHYIFSWNNSESWVNETGELSGTINWSNITKNVTATNSSIVKWVIYANDSLGNWNNTGVQIFKVGNSAPTQPNLTNPANNSYTNTTPITMNWTASTDADSDTVYYYVLINGTQECYTNDTNCSYTPSETYYEWHVIPFDGAENGTSSVSRFYTYDIEEPIITDVSTEDVTSGSATLTAMTNENADCAYATTNKAYSEMTTFSTTGGTSHSTPLTGLSASTRYTRYVRCRDTAGNVIITSNSTTFTTSSSGGGGGGGGSSVSYEQKSVGTLAAGSSKEITFLESTNHGITKIEVTVKNRVTNAKIRVDTGSLPSGASKPSTKGSVYKYIEITKIDMTDDDIEKAVIQFKVKKSWLTNKGYGKDAVTLHRYNNKKWENLETTRTGFGAEYYYYSAESSGFSTFAITAEKAPPAPTTGKVTESAKKPEEETTEEEPDDVSDKESIFSKLISNLKDFKFNISWLWPTIIVMTLLAIYFVQKKWKVLNVSIGMESEAIIAITTKMQKAEKFLEERDIDSAKKTYKKILKIYDGLPINERKWVYKEIQSLYKKLKTTGGQ